MESKKIHLLGLSGSIRKASTSTAILETMRERMAGSAQITIFPLSTLPLYNADDDGDRLPSVVRALKDAIVAADGLLLCSPEYNYGTSGVLKNALDWASRPAYQSPLKGKPALIITSSPGILGGVRAQQQIRDALVACLARVVAVPQVVIGGIYQKIVDGRLVDDESLGFVTSAIDELVREVHLLRHAEAIA